MAKLAALGASLAFVLGITLRPVDGRSDVVLAPWGEQQLNAVNVVGNIVLFALPAALLSSYGWPLRRTIIAGLIFSVGIELLQLVVPGRTTATADVILNTIGAAVGWLLVARSERSD